MATAYDKRRGGARWPEMAVARNRRCYACGGEMEPPLCRTGSPRCLDCRASDAPLDASLFGSEVQLPAMPIRAIAPADIAA